MRILAVAVLVVGLAGGCREPLPDRPAGDARALPALDGFRLDAAAAPSCRAAVESNGWQLCDESGGLCSLVFADSTGCPAACARLGLSCRESHEDVDGLCAPRADLPALGCAETGHISDHCTCGPPGGSSDAGARDAGAPGSLDPFRAFPGAEGYGAMTLTTCSRKDVRVRAVTSLANSGPGTLREALAAPASSPDELRIIIFQTGGTIVLDSALTIRSSCLYIAGQTARGGGIQLRYAASASESGGLIQASDAGLHDIMLRYLRVRAGSGGFPNTSDSISFRAGENLVFDHLSAEYGSDEGLSVTTSTAGRPITNVTVSRSIVGAPIGDHRVGSIMGQSGSGDSYGKATGYSIHHNFYVDNSHRNPMLQFCRSCQVVNNLVYNWNSRVSRIHGSDADVIGNWMVPGPTNPKPSAKQIYLYDGTGAPLVYFQDNFVVGLGAAGWNTYYNDAAGTFMDQATYQRKTPLVPPTPITTSPATAVQADVLADVGANATLACDGTWLPSVDAVDQGLLTSIAQGRGRGPGQTLFEDYYGGFPNLAAGSPCADADGDWLPDAYEARVGLNPADASDGLADPDGDGYTNLEEYLNGSRPR